MPDWQRQIIDRASAFETQLRQRYGPTSTQAVRWATIRSELYQAQEPWEAATRLWLAMAAELATTQAPQLQDIAHGAYQAWAGIPDPEASAAMTSDLVTVLLQAGLQEEAAAVENRHSQQEEVL